MKFKYVPPVLTVLFWNKLYKDKTPVHAVMVLVFSLVPLYFLFFFTRNLIIENFIPPEEKNKIINRLHFDSEEDQWKVLPLLPSEKYVK